MTKKYELTDITKITERGKLYRIRALKSFGDIIKGDLGGWVSSPNNLSQEGSCWVHDEACMFDDSRVRNKSNMYDNSCMFDNSRIHDSSRMYDDSHMYDKSHMYGNSRMCEASSMHNNARMWDLAFMCGSSAICDSAAAYGNATMDDSRIYDNSSVCGDSCIGNMSIYKEVHLNNLSVESSIHVHIKKTPIIIYGYLFKVIIVDDNLIIGCKVYILSKWKSFSDDEILNMVDGNTELLKIWNLNKENIFRIAESHQTED